MHRAASSLGVMTRGEHRGTEPGGDAETPPRNTRNTRNDSAPNGVIRVIRGLYRR
jgi:hypothetical protein